MHKLLFQEWLTKSPEVMYGFRPNMARAKVPFYQEEPIEAFNTDKFMTSLGKMGQIDHLVVDDSWPCQLTYGQGLGKIYIVASPYGSYKIILRRYVTDAQGNLTPICRLVVPLVNDFNHRGPNDPGEEVLAVKMFDKVKQINKEQFPAPNTNWHEQFVKFVYEFGKVTKLKHPEIMKFAGIVKLNNLNYIVIFDLKGAGVGGPLNTKTNKFLINLQYLPDRGLLRSWGYDVWSPSISWEYQPAYSEWDEYFCPTQPKEQIISCLMEIFMTY
jgi:hypothetical protein